MYADDTCISLQTDDVQNLNETVNMTVEVLYVSFNGNRPSLNVVKTQSMTITTKYKKLP